MPSFSLFINLLCVETDLVTSVTCILFVECDRSSYDGGLVLESIIFEISNVRDGC